jgi:hypothetical protein
MRRAFLLLAATGMVLMLGAGSAFAAPGNNGTIKIDGVEFDSHPDNEPHVGCTFQVDWYGYDEGDLYSDVLFQANAPTPTGNTDITLLTDRVFIGEDDATGGGSEAGLDASVEYTLDFTGIAPHPNQGYHVKLTINAEGSIGADTKYKVFWVTGCAYPPVPDQSSGIAAPTSPFTAVPFDQGGSPMWPALLGLSVVALGGGYAVRRMNRRGATS